MVVWFHCEDCFSGTFFGGKGEAGFGTLEFGFAAVDGVGAYPYCDWSAHGVLVGLSLEEELGMLGKLRWDSWLEVKAMLSCSGTR